jgi:membrane protease YdiL (CAAX protease family)
MFILLGLSIVAWLFTFFRWTTVQRWWYLNGSKKFLKQPHLDVGVVFLLFCANLAVISMLTYRIIERGPTPTAAPTENESKTAPSPEDTPESAVVTARTKADSPPSVTGSSTEEAPFKAQTPWLLVLNLVLGLSVVGLMIFASRWLYGTTLHSWGLGPVMEGKWARTLAVSWLAFFLLVPPVLLLHEMLSMLIPYQHSTADALRQLRTDRQWTAVAVTFLYTAGWTPIVEEWMFRVVVQGFIEQFMTHRRNFLRWVLGPLQPVPAKLFGLESAANVANQKKADPAAKLGWGTWQFWAPIALSSLLFALAHTGQGAAPISLYVLAIGLGFLYKTTGNLWLVVLIHAYLNGLTLTRLLL